MSNDASGGWNDPKPPSTSGKVLRLKNKGQKVKVRLIGNPATIVGELNGKKITQYCCRCIFRNTETKQSEPKAFVFGQMIYYSIQDYFKDEDWGNPEQYDIEVTRTEEAGKYYTVVPKPKKPLDEAEKKAALELEVNISDPFAKSDGSSFHSNGDDDEYDPFSDE